MKKIKESEILSYIIPTISIYVMLKLHLVIGIIIFVVSLIVIVEKIQKKKNIIYSRYINFLIKENINNKIEIKILKNPKLKKEK